MGEGDRSNSLPLETGHYFLWLFAPSLAPLAKRQNDCSFAFVWIDGIFHPRNGLKWKNTSVFAVVEGYLGQER